MAQPIHLSADVFLKQAMREMLIFRKFGSVTRVNELSIESRGPKVSLGEVCEMRTDTGARVSAEVVAIHNDRVLLMPYGECKGIATGSAVEALDEQPSVAVGPGLLGRVVDAFGQAMDAGPALHCLTQVPLQAKPINPLERARIDTALETGIRVFDALLPIGRGQRVGIFAGSGVGKSSLMGMLARNMTADVNVVALIGERGREVEEFVANSLSAQARQRTVVVVATAEQPAVVRARAAYTATAIAEYFRAQSKHVFLMMDSITRFAMARREIDLAAGQPPTSRGYTPSVFSAIPALCERCGGLRGGGSITAMYTVLVEGDDHNEPISDALRATLDGHVVLSRELANEGHFPAIDVLHSVSRLDTQLLSKADMQRAQRMRAMLAVHGRQREMVDMGLYKTGANRELDAALKCWPGITAFLRQDLHDVSNAKATRDRMALVLDEGHKV
jgi:flagellum-specific ATP synthase